MHRFQTANEDNNDIETVKQVCYLMMVLGIKIKLRALEDPDQPELTGPN